MPNLRTVLLAGTLDTKGCDFRFVRDLLMAAGLRVIVADFGVLREPDWTVDVPAKTVAAAAGVELDQLRQQHDKALAMRVMSEGLAAIVERFHRNHEIDAMLSLGGSSGTAIATAAMRGLPVGFPKVMVSTVASGETSQYTGGRDIIMIPSIVDVAGLNRISRPIYQNAVACVVGMLLHAPTAAKGEAGDRPLVAASMFGNTTECIERARKPVEGAGYEVIVFHATGAGGRTMQSLIAEGLITGLLDLTTTELADEVCGGVFSAGMDRVKMGANVAIPVVLAPGCVDMCNFGTPDTVPNRYRDRNLYHWNSNVTLLRTDEEENRRIGELLAETANRCAGPVTVLLPLGGVSMLDRPGEPFWNPAADAACYESLRRNLRPEVRCIEIDANINDPEFADRAAAELLATLALFKGEELGVYPTGNTAPAGR
ncbi:MAG TPA: Tm-1-like ATP-binding domain-containing protein [Bryobacteraceae bacterium]|nr:Tm-1-like ATP-binding domain-containing protein [Bryobacteraceae bacterium]